MMTKKLLTLGLALTLMSPLASYAKMGTETSGGGDAVYVDNQMVIRDLVEQGQTQPVMDNLEFLDQTPKFRKIISAISKVEPLFATLIVNDLLKVRIYITPTSLPLLPYAVTTAAGNGADVQLAIRQDNSILVAPEFFKSNQKEYVFLHEALHGILEDNEGPMHHLRVRSIVKYIHDNIDNLDSAQLGKFLRKNNYYSNWRSDAEANYIKEAWNKENSSALRCYLAVKSTNEYTYRKTIENFEKLNCKTEYQNLESDSDLKQFFSESFPELLEAKLKTPYIERGDNTKRARAFFEVEKKSIFNKSKNKDQYYDCKDAEYDLGTVSDTKTGLANSLNMVKILNSELLKQSTSEIEKEVLKKNVGNLYGNMVWDSFEEEKSLDRKLVELNSTLVTLEKQVKACKAVFKE